MENLFYEWAVIGAGPAGIAAIGKLLDAAVLPEKILWIDPAFRIGDFGSRWRNVTSNTRVELFIKFLHAYKSFDYVAAPDFPINQAGPKETCYLKEIADPLQWISDHLKKKVHAVIDKVSYLKSANDCWELTLTDRKLLSRKVILATGCDPISLKHPGINEIPMHIALDPQRLQSVCEPGDTIAVFGSSHSAILILKTLTETPAVKKIINFYRQPIRYALYFEDYILFDDTGLKGKAADWARKYIDGELPAKIERVISTEESVNKNLARCDKVIYATGFKKRHVQVDDMSELVYDDKTGIIAPGLFGFGIAFPEAKLDRFGNLEYRVGLWKFVEYLNRILVGYL
jgi:cation diffusion facilitator CzcD-associated flavoprotein CzcO